MTFCANHGYIEVFSRQGDPRWWQMRAQSKAQDLPGHVQTAQTCQEVETYISWSYYGGVYMLRQHAFSHIKQYSVGSPLN